MIFLEFNENIPDLILKLSPKKKKKPSTFPTIEL